MGGGEVAVAAVDVGSVVVDGSAAALEVEAEAEGSSGFVQVVSPVWEL